LTVKLTVTVNGTHYDVEVEVEPEPLPTLTTFSAKLSQSLHPPTHVKAPAEEHSVLRATISGTVTKVLVSAGDKVEAGATLLMLEAMKMESEITAPAAGTVAEVAVSEGEAVSGGQVLVTWQ
jgi:methylmalonyl-CoA carboxyltransferase small subunit